MKTGLLPQKGFTLIEILVAVLVIAIGLLGNAGMQALSLNNTAIARNHSLAALEASGLASMMHANTAYWQKGSPTSSCSINCNTSLSSGSTGCTTGNVSGFIALGDSTLNTQNLSTSAHCSTAQCTALQMASNDLQQWGASVASVLPNGTGQVTCSGTTPQVSCVISISWNEQNLALNKITGTETGNLASGTSVTQTYTMVVQP